MIFVILIHLLFHLLLTPLLDLRKLTLVDLWLLFVLGLVLHIIPFSVNGTIILLWHLRLQFLCNLLVDVVLQILNFFETQLVDVEFNESSLIFVLFHSFTSLHIFILVKVFVLLLVHYNSKHCQFFHVQLLDALNKVDPLVHLRGKIVHVCLQIVFIHCVAIHHGVHCLELLILHVIFIILILYMLLCNLTLRVIICLFHMLTILHVTVLELLVHVVILLLVGIHLILHLVLHVILVLVAVLLTVVILVLVVVNVGGSFTISQAIFDVVVELLKILLREVIQVEFKLGVILIILVLNAHLVVLNNRNNSFELLILQSSNFFDELVFVAQVWLIFVLQVVNNGTVFVLAVLVTSNGLSRHLIVLRMVLLFVLIALLILLLISLSICTNVLRLLLILSRIWLTTVLINLNTLVDVFLQPHAGVVRQAEQVKFKLLIRLDHLLVAHRVFLAQLLLHYGNNTFLLRYCQKLHNVIIEPLFLDQIA